MKALQVLLASSAVELKKQRIDNAVSRQEKDERKTKQTQGNSSQSFHFAHEDAVGGGRRPPTVGASKYQYHSAISGVIFVTAHPDVIRRCICRQASLVSMYSTHLWRSVNEWSSAICGQGKRRVKMVRALKSWRSEDGSGSATSGKLYLPR